MKSTDQAWEKFGKEDPYYGVLSSEKFRGKNLDEATLTEFFQSGEQWITEVLDTVRKHLNPAYQPVTALDFGCGVGRLVIPLSAICRTVTGIDVSESVLSEARKNAERRTITNAELLKADDSLSSLQGKSFNLIHSYIVFQHIPIKRGLAICDRLIRKLEGGGVGILHFTYYRDAPWHRKVINATRRLGPWVNGVINLAQRKRFGEPMMQMNHYPIAALLELLRAHRISQCFMEMTNHSGHHGVVIYFQKPGNGVAS